MNRDSSSIKKVCECCNNEFVCNANDINSCFCFDISLSESVRREISEKYSNCLCEKCLFFHQCNQTKFCI